MKHSDTTIHLRATITSGQGKGAFFVSQEDYKKQFLEKLGYAPFNGTLNLRVDFEDTRKLIQKIKGVVIEGFQVGNKMFGDVKCLHGTIKKNCQTRKITIIVPEKSHYTKTLEVIAPKNLREDLGLNDGETVEITVRM